MIWIVILLFGIVTLSFILDGSLTFFTVFLSVIFMVMLVLIIIGILYKRRLKLYKNVHDMFLSRK